MVRGGGTTYRLISDHLGSVRLVVDVGTNAVVQRLDDELRAELLQRPGTGELRRLAVGQGMRTLRDDGLRLVQAGVTTPEEVLRVTRA